MGDPLTAGFAEAIAGFATGVVVVTVRDGRDDLGTTVTSFMSVSLAPPMVLASVATASYLTEVLHRRDRWAATVLSAGQRALAGRFAAEGRPGARILLAGEPHHRGEHSDALIPESGQSALECETRQKVEAGDHTLFIAEVLATDYAARDQEPLIRVNRRYLT
ncbi:flavin reductase family protein [Actinomadura welshii]